MPIKPENKHRYPADWPRIRDRILTRARGRCEWPGCTATHHTIGFWETDGTFQPLPDKLWHAGYRPGHTVATTRGDFKVLRIILTVAHLDHQPENCADDNLRAWCQRHHLAYDRDHHAATRARTRHERANTLELFA
jgi:hypothetical protein